MYKWTVNKNIQAIKDQNQQHKPSTKQATTSAAAVRTKTISRTTATTANISEKNQFKVSLVPTFAKELFYRQALHGEESKL
ncbi:yippee-like isoform X2 [Musca autumnalis]|uniref:yippee-like isoform X2 n=1 Tax=Musca autumnalis TaxID=221902 RepID=UPI003CE8B179